MDLDLQKTTEMAWVSATSGVHDPVVWRCDTTVTKYWVGETEPYEVLEIPGNLLMYGGASNQWQTLIGAGTTTAGQALTYFNNANAAIGVGDSATAEAATQNNLQAATNRLRVGMDATYPQHTDGVTAGSATITFRSTFSAAQANFTWNEWGLFNSPTDGVGRMLNRRVQSLGLKSNSSSWTIALSLTLS